MGEQPYVTRRIQKHVRRAVGMAGFGGVDDKVQSSGDGRVGRLWCVGRKTGEILKKSGASFHRFPIRPEDQAAGCGRTPVGRAQRNDALNGVGKLWGLAQRFSQNDPAHGMCHHVQALWMRKEVSRLAESYQEALGGR